MAGKNACMVGGGMCEWGVREASYIDMVQEAAKECLDDVPGLKPTVIDGLLFASTFVGRRSVQANTAPVVAERLGLKPTSICARVDVLCAGGTQEFLSWKEDTLLRWIYGQSRLRSLTVYMNSTKTFGKASLQQRNVRSVSG